MGIKQFGPDRRSRYKQGVINPESCKKLFESQRNQPVIYRSSYEQRFIAWLENNRSVKLWGSECVCVPYISPIDGKVHKYYPDFAVLMESGEKIIIELKSKAQTQPPKPGEDSWFSREYIKNKAKWSAVKKFCDNRGFKFWVLTEDTINKL